MFHYGGLLMHDNAQYAYSIAKEQGFTLIELMISLVLGLLISAAAMQVYLINVKTSSIQSSASELQDASVFGIQQLEKKLRIANLGNPTVQINDTTVNGGIVLTGANIGMATYANTGYLTRRAGDSTVGSNGWTGVSNMNIPSDQLTIQYINVTGTTMNDCEGSDVSTNEIVVERYFLRQSTNDTSNNTIKNLVLACDAGRVDTAGGIKSISPATDPRNFGQAGQEFIANVDQFKVLLGTQSVASGTAGQLMYLPSSAYLAIASNRPAITAIKLGIIAHGSTPIIGSDDQEKFFILGQENTLKTEDTRKKQVRTTYESTTILRNARVVNISTSLQ